MSNSPILVVGAAGKTGSAAVRLLREAGRPVRALVRTRDARAAALEARGAEIAVGDLFDPLQMRAALRGVRRAYFVPPIHPYMIQAATVFAAAAHEAELEALAVLSQWLAAPTSPALMSRQHWIADRIFALLPETAVTVVNPGFFAEYPYLAVLPYAVHLGIYPSPMSAASRNAPPSNDDIARVAVAALLDPARHAGKRYRPTGPALISVEEMAATIGRVFGRTIRYARMPRALFFRAARLEGVGAFELSEIDFYLQELEQGAFAYGAPTNDVLDVTGRPAESFETIVRRYAARPDLQPSFAARARVAAESLLLPFQPPLVLGRARAAWLQPQPPAPRFALESEDWIGEHRMWAEAAA